jgi:hypothetical protein
MRKEGLSGRTASIPKKTRKPPINRAAGGQVRFQKLPCAENPPRLYQVDAPRARPRKAPAPATSSEKLEWSQRVGHRSSQLSPFYPDLWDRPITEQQRVREPKDSMKTSRKKQAAPAFSGFVFSPTLPDAPPRKYRPPAAPNPKSHPTRTSLGKVHA